MSQPLGYAHFEIKGAEWDQVIPLIMDELGLSWRISNQKLIVAPASELTDLAWLDYTPPLFQPPSPIQIRADIKVGIDGDDETPVINDLILVEDNWTGFMVQEMRINLRATLLDEESVQLELVIYSEDSDEALISPIVVTRYDTDSIIEMGASLSKENPHRALRIAVTLHRL